MHSLVPFCLDLHTPPELGRPTERWAWKYGRVHGATLLPLPLLLPRSDVHRPSSDVSRRKVGSWEYGCTTVPFASPPVFAGPPFVCSQGCSAKLHTKGFASHQLCITLLLHIYILYPSLCLPKNAQKCLAKVLSKYTFFRLRAEQNSVEFYFFVLFVF